MKSHETQTPIDDWEDEVTGEAGLFRRSDGTLLDGVFYDTPALDEQTPPTTQQHIDTHTRTQECIDQIESTYSN